MIRRIGIAALAVALGTAAIGCGSSDDKTAEETPQSKSAASGEAAKWTPEQKAIFQKGMANHAKMIGESGKSGK